MEPIEIENLQAENNQLKASCALLLLLLSRHKSSLPQTPAQVFGSRLRELRKSRGLTQKQTANMLKISNQTYSRYERGERKIPIELILAFADLIDVSLDYLFGRTD